MLAEIGSRFEAVEECYEFMLAYAAQGLRTDEGSKSGGQVREFLRRAVQALTGLTEACAMAVSEGGLEPAEKYVAFLTVLDRDSRDSLAAIELVLAQPSISSQLIDNLNACIHLRALLTDLFLLDEILRRHVEPAEPVGTNKGD
ncbi:MAG TPA: hypothetical protein VK828_13505 [Terriglobales bacterium]|jgi:hypothetical protein|nr:hypothetical protein [Terriglobales bacterium]